ncbi:hypothetical protein BKA93DRAFT_826663 [Sparassis latifolia]
MDAARSLSLQDIDDDTLIVVFRFLSVSSILAIRETCKRMEGISRMRIVWQNAYTCQVLLQGFPAPYASALDAVQLERNVLRALRVGNFWLSPSAAPRKVVEFKASSGTSVSEVHFLPRHEDRWLVTVSKGIWSMITCWDIPSICDPPERAQAVQIAEWSPKGMLFTGFVVNSDPDSEGILAASVSGRGQQSIEILNITSGSAEPPTFRTVGSIDTNFRVIALQGELIAFSNDSSDTTIMNWRTGNAALLCSSEPPVDRHFQYNRCLQVVFTHKSILVVRARSIELFAEPALHPPNEPSLPHYPLAYHTFGWIDGVSVSLQALPSDGITGCSVDPLSILLRAETDDPWASETHTLNLFTLQPNPLYAEDSPVISNSVDANLSQVVSSQSATSPLERAPYLFPPVHSSLTSPSVHGFLRCTGIILGQYGTAVWIQPRPSRSTDLTMLDVHASETQAAETTRPRESLAAAVFAGPLQRHHPEISLDARTLWTEADQSSNWTAIDYDEELGRIALGSIDGRVTLLELGLPSDQQGWTR